MKITNIRVLNNYKVKLINAKLSGVNAAQSIISEQGTRSPVIITETPVPTFQEKFDRVFNYLINRYEPGWSAATVELGKAATMELLGVSAAINPLIAGGTVEAAFNSLIGIPSAHSHIGWFDPLTHPKDFSAAVKAAYAVFERVRKPLKAQHRFIDYSTNGIGEYSSQINRDGGNMFFNAHKDMVWYPENSSRPVQHHLGLTQNYNNKIERMMLHSPYGYFTSPMDLSSIYRFSLPWMSDRYSSFNGGWVFDQYLNIQESTTLRDLLNDHSIGRTGSLGIVVDGVTDIHLNTLYRGMSFPAGSVSRVRGTRASGGNTPNQLAVGSPWIRYPTGITPSSSTTLFNINIASGLCFNKDTLVLFDGSTFPGNPQQITDIPVAFDSGISYGYASRRLAGLNALSDAWGNSMEFIMYIGCLPYGHNYEGIIPWSMYQDPTIAGNKEYFRWRMDASVQHIKTKFQSPIDGFAHIFADSTTAIERTHHRYAGPTYTTWSNVLEDGSSYIENIPIGWARDQYNYTYGQSGGDTDVGVVMGVELFGWYDWDAYPSTTSFKKSSLDTSPKMWFLDDDIASPLYSSQYDILMGQRKHGFTLTNKLWGMGVCGDSTLGEIFTLCRITDQRGPEGYPFFYNTFMEMQGNTLAWKGISGTSLQPTTTVPVPWFHDRRFTLFYLYPTILALGGSIVDYLHSGHGYYYNILSRWFDKELGTLFAGDMEALNLGNVISNIPRPGRRTPTRPPENFWTGVARTSQFELLYCCMKAGITEGLDSLSFEELHQDLLNAES